MSTVYSRVQQYIPAVFFYYYEPTEVLIYMALMTGTDPFEIAEAEIYDRALSAILSPKRHKYE